ncbi:MAG: S-adenosyl-L-methionine-dependent methyltransferase [Piptocephalis tieghemiana]|nr:MAG: S-adenosyl-L-methionine-dependent methyltransferase [Piptocephalis tieghemiana]
MDVVPSDKQAYKTKEYWEERYTKQSGGETFDWFKNYAELKPLLRQYIPHKKSRILMLGCGNSTLSEDMYDDGYTNLVNVDFSHTVIEQMRERCADRPGMTWLEMDIRHLDLPDGSFDVVLDKGTMDALMCDKGDVWDPSPQMCAEVAKEVDEVVRVLRVGGSFIYVTFGQPHFRKSHLERPCWDVSITTMGNAFHYFWYSMVKREE